MVAVKRARIERVGLEFDLWRLASLSVLADPQTASDARSEDAEK